MSVSNIPHYSQSQKTHDFKVKYKTEKCRFWYERGVCPFNKFCAFAHNDYQMRDKYALNLKYKTKLCFNFFENGTCKYGDRCQYLHKSFEQYRDGQKTRSNSEESYCSRDSFEQKQKLKNSNRYDFRHRARYEVLKQKDFGFFQIMMKERSRMDSILKEESTTQNGQNQNSIRSRKWRIKEMQIVFHVRIVFLNRYASFLVFSYVFKLIEYILIPQQPFKHLTEHIEFKYFIVLFEQKFILELLCLICLILILNFKNQSSSTQFILNKSKTLYIFILMSNMLKILLVLGLVTLCLANTHLNVKYRDFLNGASAFHESTAREIYSQFHSLYREKSEYRFKIFAETLKEIRAHNQGTHSWLQGINDFSDMTFDEFKQDRLMAPQNCSATNSFKLPLKAPSAPDSYEWTATGMVSPVKNQGSCGSCWTFSTVGALESHWNILGKGRNQTFSEQQLVDCAGDFDNHGCHGGLPSHAFEYIKYAGGIESDLTYPYTAKDGNCVFRKNIAVGYVRFGSYNITQGDEKELAQRLYEEGPISVSFQVITGFKNYAGGVYTVSNCGKGTQDVNHAVLATGYGNDSGMGFWNVKNSWGSTWGVGGYFKIERGTNMCAIAQCNSYPLIERPASI